MTFLLSLKHKQLLIFACYIYVINGYHRLLSTHRIHALFKSSRNIRHPIQSVDESNIVSTKSSTLFLSESSCVEGNDVVPKDSPLLDEITIHHTAIKTRNITNAILFYNLLGFQVVTKFRAGPSKAAWIERRIVNNYQNSHQRLELIEVPQYLLNEEVGVTRKRAPDLMSRQDILGYNHIALDVSKSIQSHSDKKNLPSLTDWMVHLNQSSIDLFGKTIRMALPPRQQIIGQAVFEIAFILDADGCLVELLNEKGKTKQTIDSGWEPWNGTGFQENSELK
jgi:catechol 2,3-dioxygenase-like lactoylglutathione lyase family enzyme